MNNQYRQKLSRVNNMLNTPGTTNNPEDLARMQTRQQFLQNKIASQPQQRPMMPQANAPQYGQQGYGQQMQSPQGWTGKPIDSNIFGQAIGNMGMSPQSGMQPLNSAFQGAFGNQMPPRSQTLSPGIGMDGRPMPNAGQQRPSYRPMPKPATPQGLLSQPPKLR